MVATIHKDLKKTERLNLPIKNRNISTTLIVDTGKAFSILNKSLAARVVNSNPHAMWVGEIKKPQLRTFSNVPIHIEGKIRTPLSSNAWHNSAATFTVVADGLKPLIDCDLFDQLGLAVTKSSSQQVDQLNSFLQHSAFKKDSFTVPTFKNFGRSQNLGAKSKFLNVSNIDTKKGDT